MSLSPRLRRPLLALGGATVAVLFAAPSAMAHHCFVPMYTLDGPQSENWFVVSAELGAIFEEGYVAECDEAIDAGYAALKEAGLPVGIKVFGKMTIGNPKGDETGGSSNPNGANNVGLEYFGAGSELPTSMVMTWIEGAESVDCTAV